MCCFYKDSFRICSLEHFSTCTKCVLIHIWLHYITYISFCNGSLYMFSCQNSSYQKLWKIRWNFETTSPSSPVSISPNRPLFPRQRYHYAEHFTRHKHPDFLVLLATASSLTSIEQKLVSSVKTTMDCVSLGGSKVTKQSDLQLETVVRDGRTSVFVF